MLIKLLPDFRHILWRKVRSRRIRRCWCKASWPRSRRCWRHTRLCRYTFDVLWKTNVLKYFFPKNKQLINYYLKNRQLKKFNSKKTCVWENHHNNFSVIVLNVQMFPMVLNVIKTILESNLNRKLTSIFIAYSKCKRVITNLI